MLEPPHYCYPLKAWSFSLLLPFMRLECCGPQYDTSYPSHLIQAKKNVLKLYLLMAVSLRAHQRPNLSCIQPIWFATENQFNRMNPWGRSSPSDFSYPYTNRRWLYKCLLFPLSFYQGLSSWYSRSLHLNLSFFSSCRCYQCIQPRWEMHLQMVLYPDINWCHWQCTQFFFIHFGSICIICDANL